MSTCIFAHRRHLTNSPNSIHLRVQIQDISFIILTSSPYCLGFIHLQKFLVDRSKIWSYIKALGNGIGIFFSRRMAGYLACHARSSHYETCMPNAKILMSVCPCIVDDMKRENQLDATQWLIELMIRSTCFGHYYAHHQELETIEMITACGT